LSKYVLNKIYLFLIEETNKSIFDFKSSTPGKWVHFTTWEFSEINTGVDGGFADSMHLPLEKCSSSSTTVSHESPGVIVLFVLKSNLSFHLHCGIIEIELTSDGVGSSSVGNVSS
jgi:hypothetical protein